MKIIVLLDWSDDQSKMPERPNCTAEAVQRSRRVMKSFEFWRRKQSREYQLVLWHTHFPGGFVPPENIQDGKELPMDCRANLFEKQIEAVVKNCSPTKPIVLTDASFVFADDFDFTPFVEEAMQSKTGFVQANNLCVFAPAAQLLIVDTLDPTGNRFEKDWTEADFIDWTQRTTWTFAKTYAETAPHEYAVLGKPNTELANLYKATMFILRNGYVEMFYQTPFMSYTVENRRYWSCGSYDLVNRTLLGDLKTYQ